MFTVTAPQPADRRSTLDPSWLPPLLIVGILLSLVAQAWLIFNHMFSADEFHFLGHVHDYLRGELQLPLQTLHVHLFAPLAALPDSEVQQLIAGRLAMLACEVVSIVCLYWLARAWSGRDASLLAVLAFATMAFTLQHGASFRADPLALSMIMAALALLARTNLRVPAQISIGLLAALAFLVTIKVIFFAPAFAGIAAWRIAENNEPRHRGTTIRAIGAIIAIAAVAVVSIYFIHQSSLQIASVAGSGRMLTSAGSVTILNAGFLPEPNLLLFALGSSPLQAFLILASAVALSARLSAGDRRDRLHSVALLSCIAPLLSLLFYRNAFPYFIPFITAPAFVAAAWFIESRRWNSVVLSIVAVGFVITGALFFFLLKMAFQTEQRVTITAVHQIFPKPVPYIDASGMIATFPRRGFFMSGWGMAEYRKRPPIFADLLRKQRAPLLLLNGSALEHAVGLGPSRNGRFHPEDQHVLRENYIPHWGPVWVAGKRIRFQANPTQTVILIPGRYTVEGATVTLNGRQYRPGETVRLARGAHRAAGEPGSEAILRWGNRLPRPSLRVPVNLSRGF